MEMLESDAGGALPTALTVKARYVSITEEWRDVAVSRDGTAPELSRAGGRRRLSDGGKYLHSDGERLFVTESQGQRDKPAGT
ncbi:hypothetical protein SKAU_G00229680 [Synaphobranchus kaupii]|uniref:Uncharacterized protein n=1 Tax=Synaphobranchus kaupii TaxID=118154 RepID=A0A9Q1ISV3_SYNKA|nr:hypothetical protein SKAU_G00229680 [Synaphobranchus kaupii]